MWMVKRAFYSKRSGTCTFSCHLTQSFVLSCFLSCHISYNLTCSSSCFTPFVSVSHRLSCLPLFLLCSSIFTSLLLFRLFSFYLSHASVSLSLLTITPRPFSSILPHSPSFFFLFCPSLSSPAFGPLLSFPLVKSVVSETKELIIRWWCTLLQGCSTWNQLLQRWWISFMHLQ